MSATTEGRLLGHITAEEITNYIYYKYDKNVQNNVIQYNYEGWEGKDFIKEKYDNKIYSKHGFITFKYNEETKNIFYCYNSYNAFENLDYYKDMGLENMVTTESTHIDGSADDKDIVEIIKDMVTYFGGYFLENSDITKNKKYYYIPSNKETITNEMPPVIYMTQGELNEYFGGVVVIKNK